MKGSLCHLLHVDLVCSHAYVAGSRIHIIIKSHNRHILRDSVVRSIEYLYERCSCKITVAHKRCRHILRKFEAVLLVKLSRLHISVWNNPVFSERNIMLQQRLYIAQISVSYTVRRAYRTNIRNIPMSHIIQIISQHIASIETVCYNRVYRSRIVIVIHILYRNLGCLLQLLQVFLTHRANNHYPIYLVILQKHRHLCIQHAFSCNELQHGKAASCHCLFVKHLIQLPIERWVLAKIYLLNKNSYVVFFLRRFLPDL